MLWLGLYLPHLPLEVFQRTLPDGRSGQLPDVPAFAICNRLSVELANESARSLGVLSGQKRATALALAPALIVRERNLPHEQQALEQLGSWALQYTPRLSLQMPDAAHAQAGLLLDIEASLRLFGGLDALLQRLRLELQALGYRAAIGCAPTATAAWLFARWQDGLVARTEVQLTTHLAHLPVGLLASLETRRDTIEAIGVRSFRDLSQLPRSGLARRFGKALLLEMDLALGRQPELRPWFEAPLQFASTLELLADVEHAEALLFAARRQLCELAGWLAARHAGVRRFVLEARHDRTRRSFAPAGNTQVTGPVTPIEARFASPAHDVDRMLAVLRERLAIIRLPSAVHTLHLRCEEIVPAEAGDRQLFPVPASTEENLSRLVERLQARLGRDQVQRVLLAADHRPEAAYRIETVTDTAQPSTSPPAAASARAPALTRARATPAAQSLGPSPARAPTSSASALAPSSASALAPSSAPSSASASRLSGSSRTFAPAVGQTPRPLWLLHKPIALRERNQRPWWRGPLKLLSGPERIEGGWWDCNLVQRDYFIAEDDHAQWFWIYRTRGSSSGSAEAQPERLRDVESSWYLQGIFG
jgi:protein ImuB